MEIEDDEMVMGMFELLSDDLHERYGDLPEFEKVQDAFWDRCTDDSDSDFWDTPECNQLILKL